MTRSASRRQVLAMALLSRIAILVGMMISCKLIPDHNPGDDVLRFDMRLSSPCFCLDDNDYFSINCLQEINGTFVQKWYQIMLLPLTRWDAARFLSLAANPNMRHPKECSDDAQVCAAQTFDESEQAHAFFPLLPILIRVVSRGLLVCIPRMLLPSTYEGVLVLAGWLLNTTAFVMAALALYELTFSVSKQAKNDKMRLQCAKTTALLYCFNPASVFFSSVYSESLFAMLTFAGYAFYQYEQRLLTIFCWMASSYARSNGTMTCAWIALQTIAACLSRSRSLQRKVLDILFAILSIALIIYPVIHHESTGYELHCSDETTPEWCILQDEGRFSLYGYVQRQHWNVGFLRYYQWKQVPNFLLAFPILFLGTFAVVTWIHHSYQGFVESNDAATSWPRRVVDWAFFALRTSVDDAETDRGNILLGPTLLAHYAVLAAACLVGAAIAHVQISTRFICSSCPAIYWYMASLCLLDESTNKTKGSILEFLLCRKTIIFYCSLYILLGIIMHVNWLPWT